jgi:hypothetical protein
MRNTKEFTDPISSLLVCSVIQKRLRIAVSADTVVIYPHVLDINKHVYFDRRRV